MEVLVGSILGGVSLLGGVIVWAIRLEGKVKVNSERFDRLDTALAKVDEKVENLTDYLLRKNGDKI